MKIIEITVGTCDDNQVVVPSRPGEEGCLGFPVKNQTQRLSRVTQEPDSDGTWVFASDARACPKTRLEGRLVRQAQPSPTELGLSLEDPAVPPIACPGLLPQGKC